MNARIVWDAEQGWHDGSATVVGLDDHGRLTSAEFDVESLRTLCATDARRYVETGPDYDRHFRTLTQDAFWLADAGRMREAEHWTRQAWDAFFALEKDRVRREYDAHQRADAEYRRQTYGR